MNLIPTFEVGQRVRVRMRTYERQCKTCGYIGGTDQAGSVLDGTIIEAVSLMHCRKCGLTSHWLAGFYAVEYSDGRHRAVPWPLLEAIKEEAE